MRNIKIAAFLTNTSFKGVVTETSYFYYLLFIISIGRLEATAGADGDIGRSSTVDHSKALDLCFP
jgi:hypothetical protein